MISSLLFSLFIRVFKGHEIGVCAPICLNLTYFWVCRLMDGLWMLLVYGFPTGFELSSSLMISIKDQLYEITSNNIYDFDVHLIGWNHTWFHPYYSRCSYAFSCHEIGVCAPIWSNLAYFWVCRCLDVNLFPFYSMATNVLDIESAMWNHDSTTIIKTTTTTTTTETGVCSPMWNNLLLSLSFLLIFYLLTFSSNNIFVRTLFAPHSWFWGMLDWVK